jgi:UDP-N-acetyl-2-amino-2-deoxyglucuronate dehydrogenase
MRKVRIGILGGGGILGAHAPGFDAVSDLCEVVAVAEPREGRVGRIRELLGDVEIEADYHDVLARDDIDAVDILLPHDMHMQATADAAKAGKPILIEKVMARNVWECDRMIEACDTAGVSLTVCHDRRYDAQWRALKQIVDSGALGEILFWRLDHTQNVAPRTRDNPKPWIASIDGLGGGAIMSCLTHQIDALRWYGGEARSITAMSKVIPERMEGESIGVVLAQMVSGALAELTINWMTRCNVAANGLWYEMVHVTGSKGEAYYMSNRGTFVLLYDSDAPELPVGFESDAGASDTAFRKVTVEPESGHIGCIREWVKMLRGEPSEVTTGGREVRGSVEIAEAAYRAIESRRVVTLPIEPKLWGEK